MTAFLSPSLALLLVFHILIVGLIIEVNSVSSMLSDIMQRSSGYVTDATALLGGSSLLSDTSNTYVLRPTLPDHSPNTGPLIAYCTELGNKRRGDDIIAKFEGTDAPVEAVESLKVAANNANYLLTSQLHAMSLVSSVYPLPDIPQTVTIRPLLPALTELEQAASDEERLSQAESLLLNQAYGEAKSLVSSKVNAAVGIIQANQGQKAAAASGRLQMLRGWLWGTAIGIMVLLVFIFFMLYQQLFLPVLRSSKLIEGDQELQPHKGFREMRLLSSSYNTLKARRDALDEALRMAAEKDALTGLSNRYSYEHYLKELSTSEKENSVAIVIFDINFLKETNDTKGHPAGDALLKEASYCIEACFKGGRSFRVGGDEFACVLLSKSEDAIQQMVKDFQNMQKEKRISVSYGYAYQEHVSDGSLESLMKKADDAMYACKEEMHDRAYEDYLQYLKNN